MSNNVVMETMDNVSRKSVQTSKGYLIEHIKSFGERVTINGVSRIVTSSNIISMILWILFVVVSMGIMIWQLSLNISEYFSYEISSNYGIDRKVINIFPDITICAIYPKIFKEELIFNLNEYIKTIDAYENNSYGMYDKVVFDLLKKSYYLNIPKSKKNITENFLYKCIIYDGQLSNKLCDDNWVNINTQYPNCYTTQLDIFDRKKITEIALILNVDQDAKLINDDFDLRSSTANGVRVAVHPPGIRPDMRKGFSAGVAMETIIKITVTNRTRLTLPYDNEECTETSSLDKFYNVYTCQEICLQNLFSRKCNCIFNNIAFTEELHNNYAFCGWMGCKIENKKLSCNITKGIDDIYCLAMILEEYDSIVILCDEQCPKPCSEMRYDSFTYVSTWPHPGYFYETFNDSIRNGALKLNFVMERRYPYTIIDKPLILWADTLGKVGGTLSLWLGVSVITGVELFEYMFTVFRGCKCKRSKNLEINNTT